MENRDLFLFLLNSAQDSIFTKNENREYTYVNPAMARLFNCLPEDLLGRRPDELFSEDDARTVREVDDRTFAGHHVSEQREINIGQEIKLFHTNQSPIYNSDGKIIGICGIVRDLTDFYNLKLQLIQSEKQALLGQLAAGIAHEFNNLLAIISFNTQYPLIEQETGKSVLSPKVVRNLNNILKTVGKGKKIVNDLVSFARPKPPRKCRCRIEHIIDEVLRLQERQFERENIRIHKNYTKTPKVWIDRDQFEQVFLNLLINARQAITPKKGGDVTIGTDTVEGAVVVIIADNGVGMPPEILQKLFTPFFTTKGAFAKDSLGIMGTGLGLSIVRTILQNHNASIRVESEVGTGTRFIMHLQVPDSDVD